MASLINIVLHLFILNKRMATNKGYF